MSLHLSRIGDRRLGIETNHRVIAQVIEGHVNRVARRGIRDLHVVYFDDKVILEGRSRTYYAKQLAHQAVLDLTDGHPLFFNQIVVTSGGGVSDESKKNQGIYRHLPRSLSGRE